jgi:ActR/RegA family two-component response regulator
VASAIVLLVDDDEVLHHTLAAVMQEHGYDVTTAASVPEALKDGPTVVSAVRHANPSAVTMLFSASRRWTLRGRRVANVAGQYL